ncbi:MAG: acetoacetate--CoA ligase [Methylibium sp.]|uniref:acetoacetate--CoA ligase n=1 Tax=Methylibium sp. TaxID=2067992 RepID=UPI0017B2819F|nr:acetoacetate--CoA ligase [Methylibium sp.]MBA3597780.1 acetoacetate--CoA ligase [Methylibium sp.]
MPSSPTPLPEPQIAHYLRFLKTSRGLRFEADTPAGYDALWRWSIDELPDFWASIWQHFDVRSSAPYGSVLSGPAMPGARWFEGAQVNYARQVLRHADAAHAAGHPAIVFRNEGMGRHDPKALQETSWPELERQVASLALHLQRLGIVPGDRVAAFLPNTPQAIVAFLACASVGAVWSVCSPDMGPVAVLDRFQQIEPKLLIACDGYVYGGLQHDRLPLLRELLEALPSVRDLVLLRYLDEAADAAPLAAAGRAVHDFAALTEGEATFEPLWLPFDQPLWIVYSSGTTGLPKAIVHGHGGVMLNSLKANAMHHNLGASAESGDRFHWYSSSGWIMWNAQVSGLLNGATVCLYDGSPGGPAPAIGPADWGVLWRFAADAGVTYFGAGAAFYASCLKADVEPMREGDLSALRGVGSTGSPLSDEGYQWIWDQLPKREGRDIWLNPISGGTDFAGAFVAGMVTLPVVKGEMQCRCLGAAVEAWSEPDAGGRGRALVDEVGELVCTQPIPSMPLYFWNDPDNRRYLGSYFDMYPGVWRHGDWIRITPRGGAVIYGRSDATINRYGIRMGTAELYRAVEALPEVLDSLVVDLEYLGRESYMPLFVVLREGVVLDAALTKRLKDVIKTALSARHVPNEIFQVEAVPRTLSGKKMELPVKKLLMGADAKQVLNADAMANAECVDWFVAFARRRAASEG